MKVGEQKKALTYHIIMEKNKKRLSSYLVKISFVVLLILPLLFCYCYVLGLDDHILFLKIKGMLLGKSFRFLVSRLGWCAGGFCIAITGAFCIEIIYGLCDPMDMIAKQMNPSGSSYRPPLDLNMPAPESEEPAPALTDAPETEPASTSNPSQEEMELQRQMEEHVHRRLMATSPQGSNPGLLLQQARETARLKRTIADRMSRLDRDAPDFWRDHRYGFVTEGFLTQNNQVDHSPVYLERLLNELGGQSADATAGLNRMLKIRKKFQKLGTFKF